MSTGGRRGGVVGKEAEVQAMERSNRRRSRPSMEGLEGRMLLSLSGVAEKIVQHRGVNSSNPLAQTSNDTTFDYTTPQGAKVAIKLVGPGSLKGTALDNGGALNLVFSGTTVFTTITGTVKGGNGQANLATISTENVPLTDLSGIGGDLIGRILLPSFNLIPGGQVNLTSGIQSFNLNSVAATSQVHLRDTPLNTSLGIQSYVNTITGTGVTFAQISANSTGATSTSATGLSSGTSIGVATGQSAGGVTTVGAGTLNPTALGFGGGEVGAINGAIPLINTVGNGQNVLGTPGLTQTQVEQGRSINYIVGNDGGDQLNTVAGTFAPGENLIEPSDISLPPDRVPPPGVLITIKHVNGDTTPTTLPLGDPMIYGYDAKTNALVEFDATTGAKENSIPLPASPNGVGGVSLVRDGSELVVLVGIGSEVFGFDATNGDAVGHFSTSSLNSVTVPNFTVTGIGTTGGQTTVLEDATSGPPTPPGTIPTTGTMQEIDVAQSLSTGKAVPIGTAFTPANQFFLAGTLVGVPGTGNLFALGAGFFNTSQPSVKQSGILTVTPGTKGITESTRTVLTDPTTQLDLPADPTTNGILGSTSLAVGSVNSFLAIDNFTASTGNVLNLYSVNNLKNQGTVTLADPNPLADLTQSFHPEISNTALIDVQGNVQVFNAKTATGMVLNVAGNFDQLNINNASDSNVIGLPFSHVNIPVRNNVSIVTNDRLVIEGRNGVTVNAGQTQVGPLFLD
jgi:hypothetical protein